MRTCRIADALNTYSHALTVVKDKGYKIFLVPDVRPDFLGDFWAIKDKRDFIACDPLRLLGLISIWEQFGDEWYTSTGKVDWEIYDTVLSRALPDAVTDFEALSDDDFTQLVKDYQLLFEAFDSTTKIEDSISRAELFTIVDSYYKESSG